MERPRCRLCETRPPRRFCPGSGGDICSLCCGTERETTIDCPLDCEHLIAAHQHEKIPAPADLEMPIPEVRVSDDFLASNRVLVIATGHAILGAAIAGNANDYDVRDALNALVRTYKTRESGLVYETRPSNPIAAGIQVRFEQDLDIFREAVAERSGVHSIRDKDVLGTLVFWLRAERLRNNGRRRSRAFLDSLTNLATAHTPEPSRIIQA